MEFILKPILPEMEAFYGQAISVGRFNDYLKKLQGNSKDDLVLPIMGFNPMAKQHVLEKVKELRALQAEEIIQDAIEEINDKIQDIKFDTVHVVINVADDLKGAWTNYYTTDYASKFDIKALVNRNFCCPYFWSSESYSERIIKERTLAYLSRTVFNITNDKPKTAEDLLAQEILAAQSLHTNIDSKDDVDFLKISKLFKTFGHSDDYVVLFNLFYGDEASKNLGFKTYGVSDKTGFDYARWVAEKES